MTNIYHIHVTAKDIRLGKKSDAHECPVGRAVSRRTRQKVFVGTSFIEIGDNWPEVKGRLLEFIERFDQGKPVKPINFDLVVEE